MTSIHSTIQTLERLAASEDRAVVGWTMHYGSETSADKLDPMSAGDAITAVRSVSATAERIGASIVFTVDRWER